MKIEELNNKKGIVLMGIAFDDKESLIKDINEWSKEVNFFTTENTHISDFEVIETPLNDRTDIMCLVEGDGFVNPIKRIEFRSMGWVWTEDYVGNRYYAK